MIDRQKRNELIVRLYDAGLTGTEIGRQMGLTRERVRQILKRYGRDFKLKVQARTQKIVEIYQSDPTITAIEAVKAVGLSPYNARRMTRGVMGLPYDHSLFTHSRYNQKHGIDRVHLSREFLEHEYIVLNKSTNDLAKEYGFRQSTISNKLSHFGIKKDKALVSQMIRDKKRKNVEEK